MLLPGVLSHDLGSHPFMPHGLSLQHSEQVIIIIWQWGTPPLRHEVTTTQI